MLNGSLIVIIIVALIGTTLVLIYSPRKGRVHTRLILWMATCALLIALTGCSALSPSNPPTASSTSLPTNPTTPIPTDPTSNWTTYHRDSARTGYLASVPDPQQLKLAWSMHLDGAVYAEPLVIGGHLLIATEGDSLYSLDARTGQVQWRTNIGQPVPLSTLPCGNIDPLGITGTPVYDPTTGLIFAVAQITGPAHILIGLDVTTGQVKVRRPVDPPGMDPRLHQQRAALALSHGMVYIAYGGLNGDCGNYHGWVVASRTDGNQPLLSYQVPTTRQGGIWASSGPAIDASGNIYVAVGNGAATSGKWDHSDSILRLSPTLQLQDSFAPTRWPADNAVDQDLGSMGPLLLPGGVIFADGKSGTAYLLHADKLGGIGGQALEKTLCHAYGGAASFGEIIIVPCNKGLQQVQIGPGITITIGWHAPTNITGSPVIAGNTVYSLDRVGTLYALDIKNGTVRAKVSVGTASHFATPTLSGGYIFVGTLAGVTAVLGS